MANRKGIQIGSRQTSGKKPETQGRKLDYEHWAGTRERAGHRVTGPKRRADSNVNSFQKIKGRKCRSFPTLVQTFFSAIERRQNSE